MASPALPDPFFLMATENPIDNEGTFPLPEAQLDRFFLRTALGYPNADEEVQIVEGQHAGHPLDALTEVASVADVLACHSAIEGVYVDPLLRRWIVGPRSRHARACRSSRWVLRSVGRWRLNERSVPSRCCTDATTRSPPTSSACSSRCSRTGWC